MITLKNNKLPKLHLKLHKYKVASNNEYVTEYRKTIVAKDANNYGMFYYIHIFYHKKDNWSDVCVSTQRYVPNWNDWGYDFYSGKYQNKSFPIIKMYDKGLLKYLEVLKEDTY